MRVGVQMSYFVFKISMLSGARTIIQSLQLRRAFVAKARNMDSQSLADPQRCTEIANNLQRVQQAMRLCLDGKREARLVAVSKLKPASDIQCAYDAGQRHFGENYIQELAEKAAKLPKDIQWHFIGTLQSNKCKTIAGIPNLMVVETIDSAQKAETLNKACAVRDTPLRVFVQVNTSGEESKSGVSPDGTLDTLKYIIESCPKLALAGLMTIGAIREVEEESNPDFILLGKLKEKAEESLDLQNLELSMGMSDDFEEALRLGATNIRVGSTIFGSRV